MGPQDVRPAIVIAHAPFDAKRRANLACNTNSRTIGGPQPVNNLIGN